jgi:hypothetical protein
MELGSNSIYEQTGFELRRVFRPLKTNRVVTIKDIPEIFSVNVDVDDIYGESEWKNKRKIVRDLWTKQEWGTKKQPVSGILCRSGTVWVKVVNDVEVKYSSTIYIRKSIDRFYRLFWYLERFHEYRCPGRCLMSRNSGLKQDRNVKGNHINGLEGCWGYWKRKFTSKWAIRQEKLHLFLGSTDGDIFIVPIQNE